MIFVFIFVYFDVIFVSGVFVIHVLDNTIFVSEVLGSTVFVNAVFASIVFAVHSSGSTHSAKSGGSTYSTDRCSSANAAFLARIFFLFWPLLGLA